MNPDDRTTLLLVRHGATAWTRNRRLQGRTDIDLSAEGCAGVAALGPTIVSWAPRAVVVSPLRRTRTTAALLVDALREAGAQAPEAICDEDWTEHGLGRWEGLTPREIGTEYDRWRAGDLVPPEGEPPAAVRARVAAALRRAAALPGPVLVVTHGGTIRAALATCVGLSADSVEPVAAPSLTVLDVPTGAPAELGGRLRHFNTR